MNRYSSSNARYYQHRRGRGKNRRKIISQTLKMEIGQYALQKGAKEAAMMYESRVGRKLKERIIEKFARRYNMKQERKLERLKEKKRRYRERERLSRISK